MRYFLVLVFYLCFYVQPVCADSSSGAANQVAKQEDAFQRGLTALKENRLEDAFKELTAAEREHPDDPRIRNFRGILLVQMGKNAEAAAEYQESIRLDPALEDAYRNLGFLRWTERQLAPARETLERAVKLSPDDLFAHYYLGRVELDAQRYEQAFRELDQSRQPFPADAALLIQVTTGYIALGRQENARKSLDQLMTVPLTEAQSVQVASVMLSMHENERAISLIQKLSSGHSPAQATWAQFDLALAYFLAGNYEKALEQALLYTQTVRPAVAESPERAQAWSLIGIIYAHLNQGESSVNALRRAATLAPDDEVQWLNLTRQLMELNRHAEAITDVQRGLAASPKSYSLHLRLGAAYLAAGRYTEAESVFRDLVSAGDPLPTGYIGLAQVLLRTGRAEEAAADLGDAEKKLGPTFLISYFCGLALDRAGKPSEALAAFQQAVHLDPNHAEAHLHLGKTELALSHMNEAIAEFHEALRLDPGNTPAKRLLSQAYRRAGDTKNATKFAEASAEAPAAAAGDLLGDFFVPQWQAPLEGTHK
jgi:tetratricopeptide (TPR) repeat protein